MLSDEVKEMTIYERIGGEAAVSSAVDRFYERVLGGSNAGAFFQRDQHGTTQGTSVCLFLAGSLAAPNSAVVSRCATPIVDSRSDNVTLIQLLFIW